jgi:hypothetical protein
MTTIGGIDPYFDGKDPTNPKGEKSNYTELPGVDIDNSIDPFFFGKDPVNPANGTQDKNGSYNVGEKGQNF